MAGGGKEQDGRGGERVCVKITERARARVRKREYESRREDVFMNLSPQRGRWVALRTDCKERERGKIIPGQDAVFRAHTRAMETRMSMQKAHN